MEVAPIFCPRSNGHEKYKQSVMETRSGEKDQEKGTERGDKRGKAKRTKQIKMPLLKLHVRVTNVPSWRVTASAIPHDKTEMQTIGSPSTTDRRKT